MYPLPYILLNKYNDYLANKRTTSTFCICLSAVTGAQGSSKQKKNQMNVRGLKLQKASGSHDVYAIHVRRIWETLRESCNAILLFPQSCPCMSCFSLLL